jgi:hypothetical protein
MVTVGGGGLSADETAASGDPSGLPWLGVGL